MSISDQQAEIRRLGAEFNTLKGCSCMPCPKCKERGPGGGRQERFICACWQGGYSAGTKHWNRYPEIARVIAEHRSAPEPGIYGSKEWRGERGSTD